MKDTLIINLLGGPCTGKSTLRAGVFHQLKLREYNVEEVTEYAKDLTWEKRHLAISCQAYVFGVQYREIFRLLGQVDIVVTDGPILSSCIYATPDYPPSFHQFVLDMHNRLNSINYFVIRNRTKTYDLLGRGQTLEEAIQIDYKIQKLLETKGIAFNYIWDTDEVAVKNIVDEVTKRAK
jgi:hypothetical protein